MKPIFKIALLAICCVSGAAASAAELTLATWGGSYQDGQEKTTIKPFAAKGVQVKTTAYSGGLAQIRSQVQTGNVTWDVVDMQLSDAVRACEEGLLEKLDPALLAPAPNGQSGAADYLPAGISRCLLGNIVWSSVIAFDASKFKGKEPSRVADFFDLKTYPGKRALRKSPEGAMEWALIADGVPVADVYKTLATPAGVERAFKKLDTIKSSIVWWEAGAQPVQMLADGEVTMSGAFNGRIYNAIVGDKKPFDFIWEGQVKNAQGYVIVKGTKNLKAAQDFVRYATQADVLAKFSSLVAYGPLRKSSLDLLDVKVLPYLPTAPKNQKGALDSDVSFWADHADDLNQKFAVWLSKR